MNTILVIDDDDQLRRSFEKLLTGEGYQVLSAASAEAGLQTVAAKCPDAFLYFVTHLGEGEADFVIDPALEGDRPPRAHLRARRLGTAHVADARLFAGLLGRHLEIEQVHQHLRVPLRLEVAAHDAKRQHRPPLARQERRDH